MSVAGVILKQDKNTLTKNNSPKMTPTAKQNTPSKANQNESTVPQAKLKTKKIQQVTLPIKAIEKGPPLVQVKPNQTDFAKSLNKLDQKQSKTDQVKPALKLGQKKPSVPETKQNQVKPITPPPKVEQKEVAPPVVKTITPPTKVEQKKVAPPIVKLSTPLIKAEQTKAASPVAKLPAPAPKLEQKKTVIAKPTTLSAKTNQSINVDSNKTAMPAGKPVQKKNKASTTQANGGEPQTALMKSMTDIVKKIEDRTADTNGTKLFEIFEGNKGPKNRNYVMKLTPSEFEALKPFIIAETNDSDIRKLPLTREERKLIEPFFSQTIPSKKPLPPRPKTPPRSETPPSNIPVTENVYTIVESDDDIHVEDSLAETCKDIQYNLDNKNSKGILFDPN